MKLRDAALHMVKLWTMFYMELSREYCGRISLQLPEVGGSPATLVFNFASATAMTSFGELYWNFGFIGVAIGMFIIGLLYAGLWRMAGIYPQYSLLTVWLYFLVLYGMMMHSEAGVVFMAIVQYYIFFGGLFFIRNSFLHKNMVKYSTVSG